MHGSNKSRSISSGNVGGIRVVVRYRRGNLNDLHPKYLTATAPVGIIITEETGTGGRVAQFAATSRFGFGLWYAIFESLHTPAQRRFHSGKLAFAGARFTGIRRVGIGGKGLGSSQERRASLISKLRPTPMTTTLLVDRSQFCWPVFVTSQNVHCLGSRTTSPMHRNEREFCRSRIRLSGLEQGCFSQHLAGAGYATRTTAKGKPIFAE